MKELLEKLFKGEGSVDEVLAVIENEKKDMVPRSRLNDKNDEIKDLKAEIDNRDKQIDNLQKAVKGNEDLEKQLNDLKDANSKWESKYQESQINTAIKLAAKDAKDPADVLAFINKGGLALKEDGTVEGLDEALKTLRETKSYLFDVKEEPKLSGRQPNLSGGSAEPKGVTKEQFNNMGYQERAKLFREQPDLYRQLKE